MKKGINGVAFWSTSTFCIWFSPSFLKRFDFFFTTNFSHAYPVRIITILLANIEIKHHISLMNYLNIFVFFLWIIVYSIRNSINTMLIAITTVLLRATYMNEFHVSDIYEWVHQNMHPTARSFTWKFEWSCLYLEFNTMAIHELVQ